MTEGLKQHVRVWRRGGGGSRTFLPRTFGLGRFGPNISARDITATDNAKDGRFDHNNKLRVGDGGIHV